MDLYETLGVDRAASEGDLKRAYRKLAKKLHPDSEAGDAEEFKRVTGAWLGLRDPARRAHYDRTGDGSADSGVDFERQQALSLIGQAVSASLTDDRAESADFARLIRDNLRLRSAQISQEVAAARAKRGKIERNAKRWRRKKGAAGPDIVGQITASALREVEGQISTAETAIKFHALAAEILDGYEYEFTANALPSGFANVGGGFFRIDQLGGFTGGNR